jgi:hypothetical protein
MTQLKERNESPKEDPENGISDMVAPCGSQPPNFTSFLTAPALNNYGLSLADSHSF